MTNKRKTNEKQPLKRPFVYGDPEYGPEEDIYSKAVKTAFLQEGDGFNADNGFQEDSSKGEDLDIPGSELDNPDEEIGSEDEENNYYSLGGDNHEDLEEDKG